MTGVYSKDTDADCLTNEFGHYEATFTNVAFVSQFTAKDSVEKANTALGHAFSSEWTIDLVPNCTEYGSKSHHCSRCSEKSDVTAIDPNGHSYGEWFETISPNCTEKGEEKHICSVCTHEETRAKDELGHSPATAVEENRIDANCTTDGSYDEVVCCSVCTAELSRTEKTLIKLGHDFSEEWTIDKPATFKSMRKV